MKRAGRSPRPARSLLGGCSSQHRKPLSICPRSNSPGSDLGRSQRRWSRSSRRSAGSENSFKHAPLLLPFIELAHSPKICLIDAIGPSGAGFQKQLFLRYARNSQCATGALLRLAFDSLILNVGGIKRSRLAARRYNCSIRRFSTAPEASARPTLANFTETGQFPGARGHHAI